MSETSLLPRPGLFIGGLRGDLHPLRMAGLISKLLGRFDVQCHSRNVHIILRPRNTFALVDLPDESCQRHLLTEMSDVDKVNGVFDLMSITDNPDDFNVTARLKEKFKKRKRSKSKKRKENCADDNMDSENLETCQTGKMDMNTDAFGVTDEGWLPKVRNYSTDQGSSSSNPKKPGRQNGWEPFRAGSGQCGKQTRKANADHPVKGSRSCEDAPQLNTGRSESDASVRWSASASSVPGVRSMTKTCDSTGFELRPPSSSSHRGVSRPKPPQTENALPPSAQTCAATSTTGLPVSAKVCAQTSTPGTMTGLASGFYRKGEVVGRESRHHEFKAGGMSQKDRSWLQDTVGKYVCGFLNSAEGGCLSIGVNDQGKVIGFQCCQAREDDYRLLIDEALKSIEPAIFPDSYQVRFIPVMEEDGHLSENLQVLQIQVFPPQSLKNLYDFRGHAYIRRDGSLQGPLKARQVQEWTRKQMEKEYADAHHIKSQLHEVSQKLEQEQQKSRQMAERLIELGEDVPEIPLTKKRSRICTIM